MVCSIHRRGDLAAVISEPDVKSIHLEVQRLPVILTMWSPTCIKHNGTFKHHFMWYWFHLFLYYYCMKPTFSIIALLEMLEYKKMIIFLCHWLNQMFMTSSKVMDIPLERMIIDVYGLEQLSQAIWPFLFNNNCIHILNWTWYLIRYSTLVIVVLLCSYAHQNISSQTHNYRQKNTIEISCWAFHPEKIRAFIKRVFIEIINNIFIKKNSNSIFYIFISI